MEEKKKLIAIGIDVDGKKIEFDCTNGHLCCSNNQLISLTIPKGINEIWCWRNQLTELIIPEGVENVECEDNNITQLTLPSSVKHLWADKEVTGLEKHIGKVEIELW